MFTPETMWGRLTYKEVADSCVFHGLGEYRISNMNMFDSGVRLQQLQTAVTDFPSSSFNKSCQHDRAEDILSFRK